MVIADGIIIGEVIHILTIVLVIVGGLVEGRGINIPSPYYFFSFATQRSKVNWFFFL